MLTVNVALETKQVSSWARAIIDAGLLAVACTPFLLNHYNRLLRLAYHDDLTGLPNRALFHDRLNQIIVRARREHEHVSLIFLDIDRFKPVNDAYGHYIGDQLLKQVAMRLRQSMRESDTVARLGGDEFAVILSPLNDPVVVAEKIIADLSKPFDVNGYHLQLGVSVGVAFYPEDGDNDSQLLKAADDAMYRAKRSGRAACCVAGKSSEAASN